MRQMRTKDQIRELILKNGHQPIAIMKLDPKGKKGELIPDMVSDVSLHELIEYIHLTGNCTGRHLSGGERQAIVDGKDPADLSN